MRRFWWFIVIFAAFSARAEYVITTDTLDIAARSDTTAPLTGNWVEQLIKVRFNINDPRINYPRFPNFCRNVYNWADRTFNSYDPAYVVGTGKNWKLYAKSFNWFNAYEFAADLFSKDRVEIYSRVNSDLGFSLNFMAVSIGYTWNVNQWITGNKHPRKTFDFSFTCSRFSIDLISQTSSGNAIIRGFGDYDGGKRLNIPFENINQNTLSISGFYFFNNRRYSQSAAYNFSKYQLRSAGSWLAGFRFGHQQLHLDFSDLPDAMLSSLPELPRINSFDYKYYALAGGYAFNWVWPHHWLFNVTALPSVGYRRSLHRSSSRSIRDYVSLNGRLRLGLTYNHRALFLGVQGQVDGGFVLRAHYSLFNTTSSASAILGFRF